jgi:hypothetical protein
MLGLNRKKPDFRTSRLNRYLEYIKIREVLKKRKEHGSSTFGFCLAIIDVNVLADTDESRAQRYPELWKRKPEKNMDMGYWFPREDYKIRIDILNEIIEEIYCELNILESAYLGFMEIFNIKHNGR